MWNSGTPTSYDSNWISWGRCDPTNLTRSAFYVNQSGSKQSYMADSFKVMGYCIFLSCGSGPGTDAFGSIKRTRLQFVKPSDQTRAVLALYRSTSDSKNPNKWHSDSRKGYTRRLRSHNVRQLCWSAFRTPLTTPGCALSSALKK